MGSSSAIVHNLPRQTTTFIGRRADIKAVSDLLADPACNLLTLVGPGGIGKTRLALEVAAHHLQWFAGGIYFVGLQPITSADNIIETVASAVGCEFYQGSSATAQLLHFLQDRQLLLILDNYEHLLPASDVVMELLSAATQLKLLITSREGLNLRDEWLFHVKGMAYPRRRTQAAIDAYSAVKLFVERAQRVRHDFSLVDEAINVARVCQLVEGVPLGIELAATWLRRLPCSEIAAEIQQGLDILETDMGGVPPRHQSMRAVFDHSWKLLNEEEHRTVMGLSVFRGGFRREAAEQVAGASLQTLSTLVDKSILNISNDGRYGLHELQRQYAEERLKEAPILQTAVHNRHCEYYCEFMNKPVAKLIGPGNKDTLHQLEAEIDNVRSAWNWAVACKQVINLNKAMTGLYWFAWLRSWHEEGERAFRHAVEALRDAEPNVESETALGCALSSLGAMSIWLGRSLQASECLQESVSILRRLDAREELTRALCGQGWLATTQQDWATAKPLLMEAAAMAAETGQHEIYGFLLGLLGRLVVQLGEYEEAEQYHRQALLLARQVGDQRTIADALLAFGKHARQQGQYARANQLLEESLVVSQAAEISTFMRSAYTGLGKTAEAMGELEIARGYFEACLHSAKNDGRGPDIAWSLVDLATVQVSQGEFEAARKHYLQSSAFMPDRSNRLHKAAVLAGLANIALQAENFIEALEHYEASLVINREIGDRIAIANNLEALARINLVQGDFALSRQRLLESLQAGMDSRAAPIILTSMMGIAELFARQGDLPSAVRLVTIITNHPASTARAKERAGRLLAHPEAEAVATILDRDFQSITQTDLGEVATRLVAQLAALIEQPLVESLSERELEVLRLIALGKTNREIARDLTLALGTIKSHIYNIMQKLDASNRTEAVTRAREHHLL